MQSKTNLLDTVGQVKIQLAEVDPSPMQTTTGIAIRVFSVRSLGPRRMHLFRIRALPQLEVVALNRTSTHRTMLPPPLSKQLRTSRSSVAAANDKRPPNRPHLSLHSNRSMLPLIPKMSLSLQSNLVQERLRRGVSRNDPRVST